MTALPHRPRTRSPRVRVLARPAHAIAVLGTGAASLVGPSAALACTVCFGGQPNDWTGGFYLGTLLMLSLPPLIVVGAGFMIYRAIKRQEQRVRERDAQRAREALGAQSNEGPRRPSPHAA